MASPDDFYEKAHFKSPSNATKAFALESPNWGAKGAHGETVAPPRPKFLFMVRFVRGVGEGGPSWANGLPLAVKRMDRPTFTPQTTVLTQYNKKRIINTGIRYDPVSVEFHDTADSMANYLWYEYATHHFGDFRKTNEFDWGYDQTGDLRDSGGGFGMAMPVGGADAPGALEAGNFFSKVECYQFYGAHYVQYDLVNPKITKFDPDDFDYEANAASHSIKMTLDYEAVIMHNAYLPLPIVSNPELVELLGGSVEGNYVKGGVLDGEVFVPDDVVPPSFFNTQIPGFGSVSSIVGDLAQKAGINYSGKYGLLGSSIGGALDKVGMVSGVINTAGSVLNGMGKFDFGKIGSTVTGGINVGSITGAADRAVSSISNIFGGSASQANRDSISAKTSANMSPMSAITGLSPSNSTSLGLNNALRGPTSSVGLRTSSAKSALDNWL